MTDLFKARGLYKEIFVEPTPEDMAIIKRQIRRVIRDYSRTRKEPIITDKVIDELPSICERALNDYMHKGPKVLTGVETTPLNEQW